MNFFSSEYNKKVKGELFGVSVGKETPIRHPQCDSSSVGRAAASQAAGRGFEPRLSLGDSKVKVMETDVFMTFVFYACVGWGLVVFWKGVFDVGCGDRLSGFE